jgi:hypothetical protein
MARPSKFTPETVKKLTDALAQGLPQRWACAAASIGETTLADWLAREDAGVEEYRGLRDAIKEAQDKATAWHLLNIKKHSARFWTASAWILERTHPEEFGKQRVEHTGAGGGPIQHQIAPIIFSVVPPENADEGEEQQ